MKPTFRNAILFIGYRVMQVFVLFYLGTLVIFSILNAAPGGATAALYFSPRMSPLEREALAERLGTNDPLFAQYQYWMFGNPGIEGSEGMINGDFGASIFYRQEVSDLIEDRMEASTELVVLPFFIAMLVGVPIGILLGVVRRNWLDHLLRPVYLMPLAVPVFWLALLLLLHASRTGDFPMGNRCPATIAGCTTTAERIEHLRLPLLTTSVFWVGMIALMVRAALVDVGQRMPEWTLGAVLGETFLAILHATPMFVAGLISTNVIVETIFSWPGVGRLFYAAATQQDYPVMAGILITSLQTVLGLTMISSIVAIIAAALMRKPLLDTTVNHQPFLQAAANQPGTAVRPRNLQIFNYLLTGLAALVLVGIIFFGIILSIGDQSLEAESNRVDVRNTFLAPGENPDYPLGTDDLGRDLALRLRYGLSISFVVAFSAALVALGIAFVPALIGGLLPDAIGRIFNGLVNTFLMGSNVLPGILLLILALTIIAPTVEGFTFMLGIVGSLNAFPALRAGISNLRNPRQPGEHHHPAVHFMLLLVYIVAFNMAAMLLLEVTLSYLGLGVRPPTPSLGNMLSNAQSFFRQGEHLVIYPGLVIMPLVFSLLMIASFARDRLNFLRPPSVADIDVTLPPEIELASTQQGYFST